MAAVYPEAAGNAPAVRLCYSAMTALANITHDTMSDYRRPACLAAHHCEELATGLIRVGCQYRPDALRDDSFLLADIPLPTNLVRAVEKRRTEYLAGRWCAREALQQLGITGIPGINEDRSPQWPAGAVGSITHSHGQAEVLVADASLWRSVGLDTEQWVNPERAARLEKELFTSHERQQLARLSPLQRANRLTLIFSAKESLFKALYPLTGKRFYFQDAERRKPDRLTLLRTLSEDWPRGTEIPFRWRERQHGVLSWIALSR